MIILELMMRNRHYEQLNKCADKHNLYGAKIFLAPFLLYSKTPSFTGGGKAYSYGQKPPCAL